MLDLSRVKDLVGKGDVLALAQYLAEVYPKGLLGERDELVTLLMKAGLNHADAVSWAGRLEKEGYAHHLPGSSPRWAFTSKPVSFHELARAIRGEWSEFVGNSNDALDEAIEFFEQSVGVDREVAQEIYRALEAAGYASVVYQEGDAFSRDRVLFDFPEVFTKQV